MTREEKLQEIIREIFQKVFDGMANPLADGVADIVFKVYELGYNECKSKMPIWKHWKDGIAGGAEGEQIFLTKIGRIYIISSCLGCECDYIELSELDKL